MQQAISAVFDSLIVEEAGTRSIINALQPKKSALLQDGSLYISERVIPVPGSVSQEARRWLGTSRVPKSMSRKNVGLKDVIEESENVLKVLSQRTAEIYPVAVHQEEIGGILCDVILPYDGVPPENRGKAIINFFSGMGIFGKSGFTEAIPMACLLKTRVVKPHYRLMPEHPFPCNIDDIVCVYRRLIEDIPPSGVGFHGASNGGVMTFQAIARLRCDEIPLPGAVASWGGGGGCRETVDSSVVNRDLDPMSRNNPYKNVDSTEIREMKKHNAFASDPKDPLLSPYYSNLEAHPPAFLSAGSRDIALSQVLLMHQALRDAGAESELNVFEAMPHGFMYYSDLPEARRLYAYTADFFARRLSLAFP